MSGRDTERDATAQAPTWRLRRLNVEIPSVLDLAPAPVPVVEELQGDPSAGPAAMMILRHTLDVLNGRRAVGQLQAVMAPSPLRYLRVLAQAATIRRVPVGLLRVHVAQPADGAAEVAATIRTVAGPRAVAARLDRRAVQVWHCTAFHVL